MPKKMFEVALQLGQNERCDICIISNYLFNMWMLKIEDGYNIKDKVWMIWMSETSIDLEISNYDWLWNARKTSFAHSTCKYMSSDHSVLLRCLIVWEELSLATYTHTITLTHKSQFYYYCRGGFHLKLVK